jgi:hypothetical protein
MSFADDWERCAPWLQAALDAGGARTHSLADVEALVRARDAVFWPGRRSALVTLEQAHPKAKALHLWLFGGDLDECLNIFRPAWERYARASGCDLITITGRAGWERTLKQFGYRPLARLFAKDIS